MSTEKVVGTKEIDHIRHQISNISAVAETALLVLKPDISTAEQLMISNVQKLKSLLHYIDDLYGVNDIAYGKE